MVVRRAFAVLLSSSLVACISARPAVSAPIDTTPAVEALSPEAAAIALRRSIVADEYFWLRAKVLEGEAPAPFAEAFAAMQDLRTALGSDASAWEDLEVPLGSVASASELAGVYGSLPEQLDVGGKMVTLRATALRLAHALETSERAYRGGPYKEHSDAVTRAAKDLSARLTVHEEDVLRAIENDMNLPGVGRPIVVTLVGDAPYPNVFAADDRGTTTANFVRVRGLEGPLLVETVLGEVLHAVDEVTVRAPTAMNMLRASLKHHGLDEQDPNVEMAVNTVTLAESASLVRRFVDPQYRPMGEGGFYSLYPPAAAIVAAWDRHVEGEPLEQTADAIAQAVTTP